MSSLENLNRRENYRFELPSSMEAVRKQKEDLPHDSENPLFPFGHGLCYYENWYPQLQLELEGLVKYDFPQHRHSPEGDDVRAALPWHRLLPVAGRLWRSNPMFRETNA